MNTRIKISVSQKSALAAGRSSYGAEIVTLSDANVAVLTPEEREEILTLKHGYQDESDVRMSEVITDSGGLAGVREALQFHRAERIEKETEKAREYQEIIAAILAAPSEDLIDGIGLRQRSSLSHFGEIPWSAPELACRKLELEAQIERSKVEMRAETERLLSEMRAASDGQPDYRLTNKYCGETFYPFLTAAEREEIDSRLEAIKTAHAAAEQAQRESAIQQCREYALTGIAGEAARRAAAAGYDVTQAVIDSIVDQLPESDDNDMVELDGWTSERHSPSIEALDLADRLADQVAKIVPTLPAGFGLEVSRVLKCTVKGGVQTGVVVTVAVPDALAQSSRYLAYWAEKSEDDDDSSDDE